MRDVLLARKESHAVDWPKKMAVAVARYDHQSHRLNNIEQLPIDHYAFERTIIPTTGRSAKRQRANADVPILSSEYGP
jgi:hypothetical protein